MNSIRCDHCHKVKPRNFPWVCYQNTMFCCGMCYRLYYGVKW